MAVPIGIPRELRDALVRARVISLDDLDRVSRIVIDMKAGDTAQMTVTYIGGREVHTALADFMRQLSNTDSQGG